MLGIPDKWRVFLAIDDLLTTIVVGIVCAIVSLVPHVNPLYVPANDSNSAFPHNENSTVPTIWLNIITFGCDAVIIVVFFFLQKRFPMWFRTFNPFAAAWSAITVVLMTVAVTEVFKVYVGRARPDIYSVCGNNVNFEECKKTLPKEIEDQYKSWPSGHSSIAMSGLSYIALFGIKLMKTTTMWATVIWSGFIMLAIYIGATRIVDFRHHTDDVLAGLFIGFLWSVILWSKLKKRIFTGDSTKQAESEP